MQPAKPAILSTGPVDMHALPPELLRNVDIDIIPFTRIELSIPAKSREAIKKLVNEEITAVFTSSNALRSISGFIETHQPEWAVYCIGRSTAELAKIIFGDRVIGKSAHNAATLAGQIIAGNNERPVVFFCGNLRRDELPETLKAKNIPVQEIIVYETILTAKKIDKKYDAVLFFSPSAVESFFQSNQLPPSTQLFAIGQTTADAARRYTDNEIIVAEDPDKIKLTDLAARSVLLSLAQNKKI